MYPLIAYVLALKETLRESISLSSKQTSQTFKDPFLSNDAELFSGKGLLHMLSNAYDHHFGVNSESPDRTSYPSYPRNDTGCIFTENKKSRPWGDMGSATKISQEISNNVNQNYINYLELFKTKENVHPGDIGAVCQRMHIYVDQVYPSLLHALPRQLLHFFYRIIQIEEFLIQKGELVWVKISQGRRLELIHALENDGILRRNYIQEKLFTNDFDLKKLKGIFQCFLHIPRDLIDIIYEYCKFDILMEDTILLNRILTY